MSYKTGALISATITLLIFTVIPLMSPGYLPPSTLETIAQTGIEVSFFVNQLAIMGVAVAGLTLVKGFVEPSSSIYLLTALVSSGVTFVFTLVTMSLGRLEELGNLGLTTMNVDVQGSVNAIVLDFRLFIQLTALTVALRMGEAVFAYLEARKKVKAPDPPPMSASTPAI